MNNDDKLIIYTDGSSIGNPGPGGWAFVVNRNDILEQSSGGFRKTTNNRMEFLAVIKALKYFDGTKNQIVIHTDSQLVLNTMTKWVFGWHKKNWKKSDNKPILNLDLVKELFYLTSKMVVKWEKVIAHSGDELNEMCDILARTAADNATDIDYEYEQIPNSSNDLFSLPIIKQKNDIDITIPQDLNLTSNNSHKMNNKPLTSNDLLNKDVLIENDKLIIYIFNNNGITTLELRNKIDPSRSSLFDIKNLPEFLITILKNADG